MQENVPNKVWISQTHKVNHQQSGWRFDKDFSILLVSKVKRSVPENICHNNFIRNAARNYDFESCDKLLENVNGQYMRLKSQMTLMHFIPVLLLLYPQMQKHFLQHQNNFTATLMAMNLARPIQQEFPKQKEQSTTHTQKIVCP